MKVMTTVMFAALLAGCGGWTRPNTSEAEFNADKWRCQQESAAAYPPIITTSGGYTTPSQTRCTTSFGVTNCSTTPGTTMPGVSNDQNALARSLGFDSCMRARGYTFSSGMR